MDDDDEEDEDDNDVRCVDSWRTVGDVNPTVGMEPMPRRPFKYLPQA
jgi:hypothetical protein